MIRAVIVDDSKVVQDLLYHVLSSDSHIQVVGVASTGYEAIELIRLYEPDVITMDIHMPGMDGYETTREIMKNAPTPIIIVSGSTTIREPNNIFRSLEAGALAVIQRPPGINDPEFEESSKRLIQTVISMSKVRITRLFSLTREEQKESPLLVLPFKNYKARIKIIAIGASTGGPIALQKILSRLPSDLPVPVLIVQHIDAGFTKALVEWLSMTSGIQLKIAKDGDVLTPGIGYIAPDHFHMGINRAKRIRLNKKTAGVETNSSINYLFHSVAQNLGLNAFGILLSGMGIDGVEALKVLKDKGALTIVQDEESSLVFDMPGKALSIGAADISLSPEGIAVIMSTSGSKE